MPTSKRSVRTRSTSKTGTSRRSIGSPVAARTQCTCRSIRLTAGLSLPIIAPARSAWCRSRRTELWGHAAIWSACPANQARIANSRPARIPTRPFLIRAAGSSPCPTRDFMTVDPGDLHRQHHLRRDRRRVLRRRRLRIESRTRQYRDFCRRSARWDPKTGGLGADPREVPPLFFCLDPAAKILYAANADEGYSDQQNTDTIVPFRINQANGMLAPNGQVIKTTSPCTIVFAGV